VPPRLPWPPRFWGITLLLYQAQGPALERDALPSRPLLTRSRAILTRISALFAIDALGGGFLTAAMLSYFFFERFGASEAVIGRLFAAARVMNAGSHLAAAWLAGRIGLVNTMVFTHLPSSLLLMTVAVAPSFEVAAILFLLREGLVEMDVPTRQSYVLAVVEPEERTFASGITNLVRLGPWAIAPGVAGLLAGSGLHLPLITGAAMKIVYDLLLWCAFRAVRPPEKCREPERERRRIESSRARNESAHHVACSGMPRLEQPWWAGSEAAERPALSAGDYWQR
jgi:hypothetical protein